MSKIYFAASIRGGREDAQWYGELAALLRTHGQILSEHVADPQLRPEEQALTERQIFQQDLRWIREADAVVAEVTTPSLGVGYELGYAEALKVPVLCLFQEDAGKSLSAMIRGSLYFENNVISYRKGDTEEIKKILDSFFATSVVERLASAQK